MIIPVKDKWLLTSTWEEPRPLSVPPEERDHNHGAWDIGVPEQTIIYAPESGRVYYYLKERTKSIPHALYWDDGTWFAFSNYYWDVWGALIILEGFSGRTHVFAHINRRWMLNAFPRRHIQYDYDEDSGHRWWWNRDDPMPVAEGAAIGASGNDGYSTGPHIHWEQHPGRLWYSHANRLNPRHQYPREWEAHKNDLEGV